MSFPFDEYAQNAKQQGHSDEFIDLTMTYARNLDKKGLPVIFSIEHLAVLIGLPSSIIKEIIQHRSNQYTRYKIRKKNKPKEHRVLMSPDSKLKYIQKWINKNILQKIILPESSTAYIPGKSVFINAYTHRNSDKILKVDLLKFFDTISEERIFGYFRSIGYHPNLAFDFAKLTTTFHFKSFWDSIPTEERTQLGNLIEKRPAILPQGAPTSPQLANCIASSLDQVFEALSKTLNCRYSRYADDLIFSTTKGTGKLPEIATVKRIIEQEGFFVNENKTKQFNRGRKQYVTGFTVTHGVHVPKKFRQEIIKHIYYARKYGPYNHLKKWMSDNSIPNDFIYDFHNWLLGKISFVLSADYSGGMKMMEKFNKINWPLEDENEEDSDSKPDNIITNEKKLKSDNSRNS